MVHPAKSAFHRRAALPADARSRPVQRSDAAGHAASLPYELRAAREPPFGAARKRGLAAVTAVHNRVLCILSLSWLAAVAVLTVRGRGWLLIQRSLTARLPLLARQSIHCCLRFAGVFHFHSSFASLSLRQNSILICCHYPIRSIGLRSVLTLRDSLGLVPRSGPGAVPVVFLRITKCVTGYRWHLSHRRALLGLRRVPELSALPGM
jgi:hypothetical protein